MFNKFKNIFFNDSNKKVYSNKKLSLKNDQKSNFKIFDFISKKVKNSFIIDFNDFKFAEDVRFSRQEDYTIFDLKNELLDKSKKLDDIFTIYWNVYKSKYKLAQDSALIKSNIFVIKPGKIGREFNKTFCMLTEYKAQEKPALFEVLNGEGYFILESQGKVKFVKIIKVKKKSQIFIPKGYLFTIINSNQNENLVCLSLIGKNTRFKKNVCEKQNGATLFYTTSGFIKNKNVEPTYRLENYDGNYLVDEDARELFGQNNVYLDTLVFDKEKGLYMEFVSLPEKFNFLK